RFSLRCAPGSALFPYTPLFRSLDDVGAIQRGTRVARVGSGEADLVVDDDVQGAARTVAARLGQVERFHDHTLAGKGCVTVHQHRSEEHTSELQSRENLVCRLLL